MLESLFNKVTGIQTSNFLRKRIQHMCFPVNNAKLLRTALLKNTFDGCFCKLVNPLGTKGLIIF